MPPELALILCIIFISIALIIDRKKPGASLTLWIPFMWMMICGSKSIGRWFYTGPTIATIIDDTAGDPLNRYFLSILIILGLFVLFKRKIDWSEIAKRNTLVNINTHKFDKILGQNAYCRKKIILRKILIPNMVNNPKNTIRFILKYCSN